MNRLAIIRSVHHEAAPIHETGCQLLQTGRFCRLGEVHPHFGSVAAALGSAADALPPFIVVPGPITRTGVDIPHGQSAGWLGPAYEPFCVAADPTSADFDHRSILYRARRFHDRSVGQRRLAGSPLTSASTRRASRSPGNPFDLTREPEPLRDAYGRTTLGQSCLLARRLVEAGVRVVVINMFMSVFDHVSWDCHGASPFSTLSDYAQLLLPAFDHAFSALIDDLDQRGRLESTLVIAAGEFGRTPRLNAAGGRDHWPGVWSVALAGGGVQGGRVVGASDAQAAFPVDRPVTPADLLATMYCSLGVAPTRSFTRQTGELFTLVEAGMPVEELFA